MHQRQTQPTHSIDSDSDLSGNRGFKHNDFEIPPRLANGKFSNLPQAAEPGLAGR